MSWLVPVLVAALEVASFAEPVGMRSGPPERGRVLERSAICETRLVPRRLNRQLIVLDAVTRCREPELGALERLERLCRLDALAYGEVAGRERCRARVEASPEFRLAAPRP